MLTSGAGVTVGGGGVGVPGPGSGGGFVAGGNATNVACCSRTAFCVATIGVAGGAAVAGRIATAGRAIAIGAMRIVAAAGGRAAGPTVAARATGCTRWSLTTWARTNRVSGSTLSNGPVCTGTGRGPPAWLVCTLTLRAKTSAVMYAGQRPCERSAPSESGSAPAGRRQNRDLNSLGRSHDRVMATERYSNETLSMAVLGWLDPKMASSSAGACAASCVISARVSLHGGGQLSPSNTSRGEKAVNA